jgi:hypothetical protein
MQTILCAAIIGAAPRYGIQGDGINYQEGYNTCDINQ